MKKTKLIEIIDERPVVAVLASARHQMLCPAPRHIREAHGTDNIPGRDQMRSIFGVWIYTSKPENKQKETFSELAVRDPRFYETVVDQVLDTIIEYGVELK